MELIPLEDLHALTPIIPKLLDVTVHPIGLLSKMDYVLSILNMSILMPLVSEEDLIVGPIEQTQMSDVELIILDNLKRTLVTGDLESRISYIQTVSVAQEV
jgi:hypothetical protein